MSFVGLMVVLIFLGLVLGVKVEANFFDLSGSLYVVGGTIGMLLLSGINIFSLLKISFASSPSSNDLSTGAGNWELLGIYALVSGAIVSIIKMVWMLGSLEDPAYIGPSIANCLITQGYSFGLAFFVSLPLRKKLTEAAG